MKKLSTRRPNLLQRFLASDFCDLAVGTCIMVAMGLMIKGASAQPITSPTKVIAVATANERANSVPLSTGIAAPAAAQPHAMVGGRKSTALPMARQSEAAFIREQHRKLRPVADDAIALPPTF
jgi:hypothetical protein